MAMIKELWAFLRTRKKYWLWPIFLVMALLGVLLVLAQGSAVAPFIYTLVLNGTAELRILGISAFYHDSAAALIEDGRIVAAAQEERFSRKKHDSRFPVHALRSCLTEGGIGLGEVDHVVFYDKPFLKFERLLETYLAFAPRGIQVVFDGDSPVVAGKALPEGPAAQGTSQDR